MFKYLNYFESLTVYVLLEPIVSYSFWYMENWLLSKPFMIYICKIKEYDLFATYYFKKMKIF